MPKAVRGIALVVTSVDEPIPGIKRFVLADQDNWELPPFRPGAHIDLFLDEHLTRTYSLCNEPGDNYRYVIAVKNEPAGRGGSKFIHDTLRVGSQIQVSVPRSGIEVLDTGMNIFVAGGIGVTPFVSAIRDMEARGQTNYVLHWSSMGEPSIIDMLEPAVKAGRVKLLNTLVEPFPDIPAIVASHGDSAKAFCCGPAPMLDAFEASVIGWLDDRKHVERFTAPKLAPSPTAVPFTVVLAKSGREALVAPEVGLLKTLEAMDAPIPVSCAGGICGSCRTRYTEGQPIHRDRVLSPAERESEVIVCVAECAGDRLVLDA